MVLLRLLLSGLADWSHSWWVTPPGEGDGSYTNVATTSNNGAGLTVSYDVAGGTASNLTIGNSSGDNYEDGDSFTVDGDTGVTGTVSI